MKKEALRVGFDLDGVILYNPIRTLRPVIAGFKKILLKKEKKLTFLIPQTKLARFIFSWAHKSSIFIAPGFEQIEELVKKKHIKAYLITARYSFLKDDFERWVTKMKARNYFELVAQNEKDEQPHLFKERMIRKLHLDYFVEDNWNIVQHLYDVFSKQKNPKHTKLPKVLWVYNIFDRRISYDHKVPNLHHALQIIKQAVEKHT